MSMYSDCNVLVPVGLMQYFRPYSVTIVRKVNLRLYPQIKVSAFSRDKTCLRCLKMLPIYVGSQQVLQHIHSLA